MAEDDDAYWDPADPDPDPTSAIDFFDRDRHLCYLQMMLELLPSAYQGQEINRLTLAYFAISGLDILGGLDRVLPIFSFNFNFMLFSVSVITEAESFWIGRYLKLAGA